MGLTAFLPTGEPQILPFVGTPGAGTVGHALVWSQSPQGFTLAPIAVGPDQFSGVLPVSKGGTGSNTGILTTGLISGISQDTGSGSVAGAFGSFVDTSAFCERLHLANLLYSVTSSNLVESTDNLFDGLSETFCTVSDGATSAEVAINFGSGNHALTNLDSRSFTYSLGRLAISHYSDRRNGTYSVWVTVRADVNGIPTTETINNPLYGNTPFGEVYVGEFTPVNSNSPTTTFINIPDYVGIKNIRVVLNRPRPNNTNPQFAISSIRYFPTRLNPNGERYNVHLAPNCVKLTVFGTESATSTTTGAARIAGGLGVVGAIYNGGNLVSSGAKISFTNLPTSETGLSTGDLWRDGTTVKVKV